MSLPASLMSKNTVTDSRGICTATSSLGDFCDDSDDSPFVVHLKTIDSPGSIVGTNSTVEEEELDEDDPWDLCHLKLPQNLFVSALEGFRDAGTGISADHGSTENFSSWDISGLSHLITSPLGTCLTGIRKEHKWEQVAGHQGDFLAGSRERFSKKRQTR
eukprot:UC4_evm1s1054